MCLYLEKKGGRVLTRSTSTNSVKYIKVMIWDCICWLGGRTLVKVDGNINAVKYEQIIDNNLWPVIARHYPQNNYIFQDDNAPVHQAHSVNKYKARNRIRLNSWPAQSPDLNVIENLWLLLKRKLSYRVCSINSEQDLLDEIHIIWSDISPAYIQSLYKTIPW